MDQRPAYGFSHRLRASVEKEQITPSPLDYYAEKVWLGASSKSYSFGHRPAANYKKNSITPGPGEYQPEVFLRKASPAFSFGMKLREHVFSNNDSPGPGEYDIERSFLNGNNKKGFSFGLRASIEFIFVLRRYFLKTAF